jgi:hypothetical protein
MLCRHLEEYMNQYMLRMYPISVGEDLLDIFKWLHRSLFACLEVSPVCLGIGICLNSLSINAYTSIPTSYAAAAIFCIYSHASFQKYIFIELIADWRLISNTWNHNRDHSWLSCPSWIAWYWHCCINKLNTVNILFIFCIICQIRPWRSPTTRSSPFIGCMEQVQSSSCRQI